MAILIAGLVALAPAGCGSGNRDQTAQKAQEIKSQIKRLQRYVARRSGSDAGPHRDGGRKPAKDPYGPAPAISGGKMLGAGAGFVSSEEMEPETSGWTVTSHGSDTVVVAGADARHQSGGLFSIIRSSYLDGTQKIDTVPVSGSGAVTITKAPLGRKIVASAQKHGEIEFKSESGITGTLHLKDDTVTLNRSGTATSRDQGTTKMSNNPHCELPGSSEYFWPERNLWRADTNRRITIVCAGGAGSDKRGAGRFLIIRSGRGWPKSLSGIDQVDVGGVGPVKITAAPRGPSAARRGQLHGAIDFRAANGVTGTLHLSNDTITRDP